MMAATRVGHVCQPECSRGGRRVQRWRRPILAEGRYQDPILWNALSDNILSRLRTVDHDDVEGAQRASVAVSALAVQYGLRLMGYQDKHRAKPSECLEGPSVDSGPVQEVHHDDVGSAREQKTGEIAANIPCRAQDSRLRPIHGEAKERTDVDPCLEPISGIVRARDEVDDRSDLVVARDERLVVMAHPASNTQRLDIQDPHGRRQRGLPFGHSDTSDWHRGPVAGGFPMMTARH